MDRHDLLTWQGLRNLASCEVFNLMQGIAVVPPYPVRGPLRMESRRSGCHLVMPARVTPQAGDILYARAGWRAPWRGEIARIGVPCVLVSAFHDKQITPNAVAEMFGHPWVQTWFGVQVATRHPQLVPMPIGVDGRRLHTLQAAERRETRDILCYLNFQANHRRAEVKAIRQNVKAQFVGQPWVTSASHLTDAEYYAHLGRSKFVLSPPGYGWDCYRTYEAIAMGAIPIVQRRPPVTDVCEALPVLLVDEWDEITQEYLEHMWLEQAEKDCRTMTMSYWQQRITAAASQV